MQASIMPVVTCCVAALLGASPVAPGPLPNPPNVAAQHTTTVDTGPVILPDTPGWNPGEGGGGATCCTVR